MLSFNFNIQNIKYDKCFKSGTKLFATWLSSVVTPLSIVSTCFHCCCYYWYWYARYGLSYCLLDNDYAVTLALALALSFSVPFAMRLTHFYCKKFNDTKIMQNNAITTITAITRTVTATATAIAMATTTITSFALCLFFHCSSLGWQKHTHT